MPKGTSWPIYVTASRRSSAPRSALRAREPDDSGRDCGVGAGEHEGRIRWQYSRVPLARGGGSAEDDFGVEDGARSARDDVERSAVGAHACVVPCGVLNHGGMANSMSVSHQVAGGGCRIDPG